MIKVTKTRRHWNGRTRYDSIIIQGQRLWDVTIFDEERKLREHVYVLAATSNRAIKIAKWAAYWEDEYSAYARRLRVVSTNE